MSRTVGDLNYVIQIVDQGLPTPPNIGMKVMWIILWSNKDPILSTRRRTFNIYANTNN